MANVDGPGPMSWDGMGKGDHYWDGSPSLMSHSQGRIPQGCTHGRQMTFRICQEADDISLISAGDVRGVLGNPECPAWLGQHIPGMLGECRANVAINVRPARPDRR